MIIKFFEVDEKTGAERRIFSVASGFIPKSGKLVEAYETDTEYIICGSPDENDEDHNCDVMGCSSVSHVVRRFPKIAESR